MNLKMQAIDKSFGPNHVLHRVDFSLKAGEVCALLGENGAGKSTLMNILGGVLNADSGRILLDDKEVHFDTPVESLDNGIGFIHQELNLVNDLTIYENLFLTHLEKKKSGFLDARGMQQQAQALFDRMNLDLDPCKMVSELDASYKQIVEICKALLQNASIIIMDEPTTSLTEPEIERVFSIMRTLKEQGVGIIFISHKLNEVMEICDTYTVLRDGNMVASGQVGETDTHQLAAHMVGHEVRTEALRRDGKLGAERLCIQHLSDGKHFHDISFRLKAGEVLGVTGLLGDGRSELFQTIFGAMGKHYSGEILLDGKAIHPCQTYQALEYGIAYLPRNRKENAILKDMSVLDNGSLAELPRLHKGIFIDFSKQNALFDAQVKNLRIKMGSKSDSITSLSGGNQQKVVLAKWLMTGPKVLLLDNPTQGVDVGAKEEIYDIIHKLASSGVAIVVISSEAQEIIRICDRALVLFHGALEGEVSGEKMNEHNIMFLATGGKAEKGGKKENGK